MDSDPMSCGQCGQPHKRCSAHNKKTGAPCGEKPMKGQSICYHHGGAAKQNVAAGERRVAEQKAEMELAKGLAAAYGDNVPDIEPAEAMLQAVSWKYAEVVALRQKVGLLRDQDRVWGKTKVKKGGDDHGVTKEAKPNIWWSMLHTAEEQLVRFSKAARDAGCDERRVELAERHGHMLAVIVIQIFEAQERAGVLVAGGREVSNEIAAREFRAIEGGGQ